MQRLRSGPDEGGMCWVEGSCLDSSSRDPGCRPIHSFRAAPLQATRAKRRLEMMRAEAFCRLTQVTRVLWDGVPTHVRWLGHNNNARYIRYLGSGRT